MKAPKKKSQNSAHYTPDFWVMLRTLYESGQFASSEKLHIHLKKVLKNQKIPTLGYLRRKIQQEGWNKHASDAEMAEKKAQSISELFEKHGMSQEERIKRNVFGITAVDDIKTSVFTLVNKANDILKEMSERDDIEVEQLMPAMDKAATVLDKIPGVLQGLKISLDYLKNAQSLCGDKAPEKIQNIGGNAPQDVYHDMTDEELDKELDRLERNEKTASPKGV